VLGDASAGALIVAGPLVRLACERHLRDREVAARTGGHPGGWWFDDGAADFIIQYFETVLRLPDMKDVETGDHLPFLLEPAQDFMVGSIFGWKGRDGYRRFREAYIEIGKGNGKTPLFAGIGL
jgi:phage terminase large subunit-like protein